VETTPEGKPVRLKLRRVSSFCNHAISGFAKPNFPIAHQNNVLDQLLVRPILI